MRHLKSILLAAAMAILAPALQAQGVWYVSQAGGSNFNDGSKGRPLKNIQKAIDLASSGDMICVAEGNYYGLQDSGNIKIYKGVSIFGGYSSDFSERDVLSHRTYIQPSAASNGSSQGKGTIQVNVPQPGVLVELDGLIMDRGNSVAYNPRGEGWPDGVDTPMMQPIGSAGVGAPGVPEGDVYTTETAIVYINAGSKCDLAIRNCAFINGPNYGILGSTSSSKVVIDNCIFVNIRMVAIQIGGSAPALNSEAKVTNNTILFTWTRLKDFGDMGYGYSYRPRMDSYLDRNIIGCSMTAALDRTHLDSPASKEAGRVTTCENSLFFLNRQADLVLPGSGKMLKVKVSGFEDVGQLAGKSGNREVTDPDFFGERVNKAYLKGFVAASKGRDMTGTSTASAPMFANHYPVDDALRLFGAVEGYGAQIPQNTER